MINCKTELPSHSQKSGCGSKIPEQSTVVLWPDTKEVHQPRTGSECVLGKREEPGALYGRIEDNYNIDLILANEVVEGGSLPPSLVR